MSNLTKIPLHLLDPGDTRRDDHLVTDERGQVISKASEQANATDIVSGAYDGSTGLLTLRRADSSVIQVSGFLTQMSIGVGPVGPTGPQGKAGSNGRNGKDGRPGTMGCSGPKGDYGPQGPTGPTGPSGGFGMTGPAGPEGPVGPTGPSGVDGKTPVFGVADFGAYERYEGSSIKQWGFFSAPDSSALFQRILLPSPFQTDGERAVILQFTKANSNVRNAVNVSSVGRANFELQVDQSRLPQTPDGSGGTIPAPATGWEFYWFVIGAEA